jgi:hypothetical protein
MNTTLCHRGQSGATQGRHCSCVQVTDRPTHRRGSSAPPQREPPDGTPLVIGATQIGVNTLFVTSLGNKVADLQNQAYMVNSKNLNATSPNSDTRLINLSVAEHKKIRR